MDPDTALAQLREGVQRLLAARDGSLSWDEEHALAGQVAEQFDALDEWLIKGGFPPRVWVQGQNWSLYDDDGEEEWWEPPRRRLEDVNVKGEVL